MILPLNSSAERTSTSCACGRFSTAAKTSSRLARIGGVRCLHFVGGRSDSRLFVGERALFFQPLLAAAVHDQNFFVAVVFQLPESPRGKPIVVVAVENDGGVRRDSRFAEQLFKRLRICQVAADGVLQFGLPIPGDGAVDVPLVVRGGVDVDFDEAEVRDLWRARRSIRW